MGTEILSIKDKSLFLWNDSLKINDYIIANYYVETSLDPEFTAIAIAMEQSATTTLLKGFKKFNLSDSTARVISVKVRGESEEIILPQYRLKTAVYTGNYKDKGFYNCLIKIAFPIANFERSLTNLWNAVGGEITRMGFINTTRIIDIDFPENYLENFKGPLYGIKGIRDRFKIEKRPIFVRSTRPAVGLKTKEMVEIARRVLRGGFDGVKDDELTVDNSISSFKERVKKMVDMIKRVEDETGEKKFYIANIIDDPIKTLKLAEIAVKAGVDGLLIAPAIQGLGMVREISKLTGLPVLSHNSWVEFLTRHPKFGVKENVWLKIQRISGADMIMLPGNFATEFIDRESEIECLSAFFSKLGKIFPSFPVLAGGKTPEGLRDYLKRIGSGDFILIAATAVDSHPDGIEEGARRFREAWKEIAVDISRE
jgi:ribulose 1,5-bisphosphate carboxylase large subunit-like protein